MAESLTESFCERCGTRYTFESTAGRTGRLSGVRVLGKGLRKLALTRASSLDEALSSARADDQRQASARQLEAFHGTFHFCLSCRQYTCTDCWNEPAALCLTCAPMPDSEPLVAVVQAVAPAEEAWPAADRAASFRTEAIEHHEHHDHSAAALGDRPSGATARRPEARGPAPAPSSGGETGPLSAIQTAASGSRAPDRPAPPGSPLTGFQPGTSLDDAIAAYEAAFSPADVVLEPAAVAGQVTTAPPAPEIEEAGPVVAEPVVAELAAAAPETAVKTPEPSASAPLVVEARPVAAQLTVASASEEVDQPPEIVVQADIAAIEPSVAPAPEIAPPPMQLVVEAPPAAPQLDVAQEPEIRAIEPAVAPAPELAPEPEAAEAEIEAIESAVDPRAEAIPIVLPAPQWQMVAPEAQTEAWAATGDGARHPSMPEAGRAAPRGAAQPVSRPTGHAPTSAQTCLKCGLSLSATARFCRRCGTRQS